MLVLTRSARAHEELSDQEYTDELNRIMKESNISFFDDEKSKIICDDCGTVFSPDQPFNLYEDEWWLCPEGCTKEE